MNQYRIVKYLNTETGVEKFALEKFYGFLNIGFWTSYPIAFLNLHSDFGILHLYDTRDEAQKALIELHKENKNVKIKKEIL